MKCNNLRFLWLHCFNMFLHRFLFVYCFWLGFTHWEIISPSYIYLVEFASCEIGLVAIWKTVRDFKLFLFWLIQKQLLLIPENTDRPPKITPHPFLIFLETCVIFKREHFLNIATITLQCCFYVPFNWSRQSTMQQNMTDRPTGSLWMNEWINGQMNELQISHTELVP